MTWYFTWTKNYRVSSLIHHMELILEKNNSKELIAIAVESRKLICGHCHANTVTSVVTFFCCLMCMRGDQKVLQLATLVNSASVL